MITAEDIMRFMIRKCIFECEEDCLENNVCVLMFFIAADMVLTGEYC